jgi:uncharacterized membrane protein YhiD involved in acid resistance
MGFEETITKLIISIVIGVIIGGEREYRNKSAGLRTIILICLGSTIFTMLSDHLGDATGASRIAANVVTGIGFLGAGAIMREGLTISGMTTANSLHNLGSRCPGDRCRLRRIFACVQRDGVGVYGAYAFCLPPKGFL